MVSEGRFGYMQVVIYWVMRTLIFLAVYGALWALRWFDIWAVLVAFLVAWIVGYIAFPRMRMRAMAQMDGWIVRSRRGAEADAAVEDAAVEDAAVEDAAVEDVPSRAATQPSDE